MNTITICKINDNDSDNCQSKKLLKLCYVLFVFVIFFSGVDVFDKRCSSVHSHTEIKGGRNNFEKEKKTEKKYQK